MGSMIEDLKKRDAFPEETKEVRLIQTHISFVFICDSYVYKVKKPVDFGFLDFTSLEKRRLFCEKEVELNRRLAGDVYIGVLPVIYDGKRHLIDKVSGETVDYAVKMKRLPEDMLMKRLFEENKLREEHLKEVAQRISEFHLSADTSLQIEEFGRPEVFKINTDENFDQVQKYIGITIDKEKFYEIKEWTERFYEEKGELFDKRIRKKRIRDCHGDLHMEHIYLSEEGPIIIDCIEFNDRFRYGDTVGDIAFLLMDLEYHGGKRFSDVLWRYYKEFANEEDEADEILRFYKVYRAFVRGKVNSFQLDDPSIGTKEKESAIKRARSYFDLAYSYIKE